MLQTSLLPKIIETVVDSEPPSASCICVDPRSVGSARSLRIESYRGYRLSSATKSALSLHLLQEVKFNACEILDLRLAFFPQENCNLSHI